MSKGDGAVVRTIKRWFSHPRVARIMWARANRLTSRILPLLTDATRVLDIGCGTGHVAHVLGSKGKEVVAVDVQDRILAPSVALTLYDGEHLPFPDRAFDASLLVAVLHHAPRPDRVLEEAARVSRRLVVMETTHTGGMDKLRVVLGDSLLNLQPVFYWHSYRTDTAWQQRFAEMGLQLKAHQTYRDREVGFAYRHDVYHLQRVEEVDHRKNGLNP